MLIKIYITLFQEKLFKYLKIWLVTNYFSKTIVEEAIKNNLDTERNILK